MAALVTAGYSLISGIYSSYSDWRSEKLFKAWKTKNQDETKRLLQELKEEHKEAEKA